MRSYTPEKLSDLNRKGKIIGRDRSDRRPPPKAAEPKETSQLRDVLSAVKQALGRPQPAPVVNVTAPAAEVKMPKPWQEIEFTFEDSSGKTRTIRAKRVR